MDPLPSMNMSSTTLSLARMKNDLERIRHNKEMKHLLYIEQLSKFNLKKNQEILRNDFAKLVAYGCVCKVHSFDKYDPFLAKKECKFHSSMKEEGQSQDESAADAEVHLPKIRKKKRSVHFGDKVSIGSSSILSEDDSNILNLPKISAVEDTEPCKNGSEDKRTTSNNEEVVELRNSYKEDSPLLRMSTLAMGFHALILWKHKTHGGLQPIKPSSELMKRPRKKREAVHKYVKNRASVFPGDCKTPATMRKFLDHEVESLLFSAKSDKRKQKARKYLEKVKVPQFVERNKTTSAIFRDFRSFKDKEKQYKKDREIQQKREREMQHDTEGELQHDTEEKLQHDTGEMQQT